MPRLRWLLAAIALLGCAEAPRGHQVDEQAASTTPRPAEPAAAAHKIPMH